MTLWYRLLLWTIGLNEVIFCRRESGDCQQKSSHSLEIINELGWEVLHWPHSPDIMPSDFYLFWFLQHFLRGKKIENIDDVQIKYLS